MSDHVKFLPPAAIPEGGAATWSAEDAERWRAARPQAVFAPIAGAWLLSVLIVVAMVLTFWNEPEDATRGTLWEGYPDTVLLFSLPLCHWLQPRMALAFAFLIGGLLLVAPPDFRAGDTPFLVGFCLTVLLTAWVGVGAWLRLRARRRQGELALAAAGDLRAPVPEGLPKSHFRRGLRPLVFGVPFCLTAVVMLAWALVADLGAAAEHPYDAVGQQMLALALLAVGMPLVGLGISRWRAARALHRGPQPVLRAGVHRETLEYAWIVPDAADPAGRPLIAYRHLYADHEETHRVLASGSENRLREEHHDINQFSEPYEVLLYGVPREGAEVVLEHAVYASGGRIVAEVTAVPLSSRERCTLYGWQPAGTSYTLERRAEDAARRERNSSSDGGGSGCGSSGDSCGSSCGSSCGGGCGGGD
ncbi:hypothetical protein [Streptomyces sp. NPDC101132]|uniref:hypothetical protein n=1 Tax=Streptomyces sp. NPDC101132 TaxID=3366110 RepID=UPI0037F31787